MKNVIIAIVVILSSGICLSAQNETNATTDSIYASNHHQAMEKIAAANVPSAIFYLKECIKMRPEEASLYYELARMYDRLQDGTQAVYYARKAYNLSPSNLWWEEYLLSISLRYKKYEEAEEVMKKRYERDDAFLDELLELYVINEHWNDVLLTLEEREKTTPLTSREFHCMMEAYMKKGDYKTIIKKSNDYMRTHPDDTDVARYKLLSMHSMGKVDKAWKEFEEYYSAHPSDGRAAYTMMSRYNELQDYNSIVSISEVVAADTTMSTKSRIKVMELIYPIIAKDTAYRAPYEKALNALAISAVDGYMDAYRFIGDYYFAQQNMPQAFKYFRTALHSGQADEEMMQKLLYIESINEDYEAIYTDTQLMIASGLNNADVYVQLGLAAYEKGLVGEAIAAIEKAASMTESISMERYGQLMSMLGTLYKDAGNDDKNDEYFERALSIIPDDASTLNNYAYYLALRKKDLDRALMMSGRAIMKERDNTSFLDTYAYILHLRGKNLEALQVMKKIYEIESEPSVEVMEHYRDILDACGKKDEAQHIQKQIDNTKNTNPPTEKVDE